MTNRFPVGGSREPVYAFMRQHGFMESRWSDKVWHRADGIQATIYGAGSMLRIVKDGAVVAEDTIQAAMRQVHASSLISKSP